MSERLTKNQRFVLRVLSDGRSPEGWRYIISLRILEERGLVGFSIGRQRWHITRAGTEAITPTPETHHA